MSHRTAEASPVSSSETYDALYASHYAQAWPPDKLAVVRECLVASGANPRRILDFGCGSGDLTPQLRAVFPEAEVVGTDASHVALSIARRAVPEVTFTPEPDGAFDLIFSHHVLEHVDDLDETARLLRAWLAPGGRMVHMLPCYGPGSLEHRLAGPEISETGTYFHEDIAHLRRLSADQAAEALEGDSLSLTRVFYRGHYWTTVEWATSNPVIAWRMSRYAPAHRAMFMGLFAARLPLLAIQKIREKWHRQFVVRSQQLAGWKWAILGVLAVPAVALWPIGAATDAAIRALSRHEWKARRNDPRASEMMLYLEPR